VIIDSQVVRKADEYGSNEEILEATSEVRKNQPVVEQDNGRDNRRLLMSMNEMIGMLSIGQLTTHLCSFSKDNYCDMAHTQHHFPISPFPGCQASAKI
jgi:hypothetical protein